jgi:ATP adenylyltransferase
LKINFGVEMDTLWSPWRSKYIDGFKHKKNDEKEKCFICGAVNDSEHDEERLVAGRYDHVIVMMNRYPYTNGHILVAPKRHIGDFLKLTHEELAEINIVNQKCVAALTAMYKPQGFNIGANLGECAGAGLPGHIHYHVLPRWNGDTSFVSTLSDIKVVSYSMEETYQQFCKELNKIG